MISSQIEAGGKKKSEEKAFYLEYKLSNLKFVTVYAVKVAWWKLTELLSLSMRKETQIFYKMK